VKGGLHAATRDEPVIRRWWASWPSANVAIRTGAASGLVVIDIDPDHGGERSLAALLHERGPLPASRTIRTGSEGRHLYFTHPGELIPNDAGRRLGPGLDVRGDGGYVIAPPSSHTSGGRYAVASHGGEIAPLPDWLLDLLRHREPERHNYVVTAREHGDAWASAAVAGELRKLQGATPGIRNSTLNRVAFRLGQIIGAGLLDQSEIEQSLVEAGVGIGLGERETALTVRSGLTAGIDLPRRPVERSVDLDPPGPALD
jgi:putative DNA primase/helicase